MFNILKGDKVLWVIIILLSIFSFLPIYSASSNLVYVIGKGTTFSHLIKHLMIISIGFIPIIIAAATLGFFAVPIIVLKCNSKSAPNCSLPYE